MKVIMMAALLISLAASLTLAAEPPAILESLRRDHPRLFLTPPSLSVLKEQVNSDPEKKKQLGEICSQADRMIKDKPVDYILIGPRLLDKSRTCLDRVSTLAFAWLMTGDRKYADRAIKELDAAAAFPDWHPPHFLDTAEMTCAFGIGYDWLYSTMSREQRDRIRKAIIEKGLQPGLDLYRAHKGFTTLKHNWSQVCNGGLAVGALAIADEAPAICAETLNAGLTAVQGAMANFGPDGSWNEGPGYWGYTTQYTAFYLDALRTALGTMHDLDKTPGLSKCGNFKICFTGPGGLTFNFADAGEKEGSVPQMFWLAKTFNQPLYAWDATAKIDRRKPFNLIWATPPGPGPAAAATLPLNTFFRRDNVVFLRGAWEQPDAMWIGFKGGDNKANHSHLDLGSFVFDALGQRWATDLGSDDYNLPGYFGKARYTYFRLKTESHNTLLINNTNQPTRAEAPIIAFADEATGGSTVADLSGAYPMTKSVLRGVSLRNGKCLLIEDEVLADKPVEVLWGLLTRATVTTEGNSARLEQKGKQIVAHILQPAGAVFETLTANPPPPQRQQPDATRLTVKLPARVTDLRLVVVFATDKDALRQDFKPLKDWPGQVAPVIGHNIKP